MFFFLDWDLLLGLVFIFDELVGPARGLSPSIRIPDPLMPSYRDPSFTMSDKSTFSFVLYVSWHIINHAMYLIDLLLNLTKILSIKSRRFCSYAFLSSS